jgi:uncharacterized NAD(P)/FAD-binding protein YdhS
MKRKLTSVIALCAIAGLSGPAFADCQDELAKLTNETNAEDRGGIIQDGSLAPLEDPDEDAGATDTSEASASDSEDTEGDGEIVQDGDTEPLEADTAQVATSGQDAAAQQNEDMGDSAASGSTEMSPEAKDAINTAKAALEAGDEKACMEAVEEARNS